METSLARRPNQAVAVRTSRALATHTPSPVRRWSRGQIVGATLFAAFIATPTAVAILGTYQP